jgi:hypothetical protein
MDDYTTETIKRCAEINGPCWECEARGDCKLLEDVADDP